MERGWSMEEEINGFLSYLQQIKKLSDNTVLSYRQDLQQFQTYLERERGIGSFQKVTEAHLKAYFYALEQKKKSATVSRHMSSIRGLYRYLVKIRLVKEDITQQLRTPKQDREMPEILTVEEATALIEQPRGGNPRQLRDRAILELLYATGIRVSELVALTVSDVEMRVGFLYCRESRKERVIPFGSSARKALLQYLQKGRNALQTDAESDILFLNGSGGAMSRQGVWKLIRRYGEQAGIRKEVTPHSLRYAFAVHLIQNGADLQSVQEMLGCSDLTAVQICASARPHGIREEYTRSHPRT